MKVKKPQWSFQPWVLHWVLEDRGKQNCLCSWLAGEVGRTRQNRMGQGFTAER